MAGFADGANVPHESRGGEIEALFAQLRQRDASNGAVTAPGLPSAPANLHPQLASPVNSYPPPPTAHNIYQNPSLPMHLSKPTMLGSPQFAIPSAPYAQSPVQPPPAPARSMSTSARTTDLLSLLKFGQPSAAPKQPSPAPLAAREVASSVDAPAVMAQSVSTPPLSEQSAHLLAAIMGTTPSHTPPAPPPQPTSVSPITNPFASPPPRGTQDYLLSLLQRPKPPQKDNSLLLEASRSPVDDTMASQSQSDVQSMSRESTLTSGNGTSAIQTSAELPLNQKSGDVESDTTTAKGRAGIFTYVNPFDELAASSPRTQTPKPAQTAMNPPPSVQAKTPQKPLMQILKHPRHEGTGTNPDEPLPEAAPRQVSVEPFQPTPTPATEMVSEADAAEQASKHTETVAEALTQVGAQVDKQVEEALAKVKSEDRLSAVNADLESLNDSKSDVAFDAAAHQAAVHLQHELDKSENAGVLEEVVPTPVAEAIKEMISDVAQGNVADSWESADAEDAVARDDSSPFVTVYNFPLKPWISINLVGVDVAKLPSFRDDSLMDIARLKKEFDQIDRTLATASTNYIVYGMSKNGGIRVIRQKDGKDTKLFAETHDRVFNVALSTSAVDSTEAIIGTGVSGTVYWSLLQNDIENFVSDTNLDKFSFALPPLNSQDNESPGGVLKTRARKSTNHPDFFAVGRGKTIHIIWPMALMKEGYVKAGPERLVDVEKYLKSRTLKINTGKAGKDFIFSPDDSAVVSLDKAGRVKFWDIRTLTNPSRKDDLRFPSPDSPQPLEIKEPLQVLLTTQPTEKSWPTSVLLVDKLRPYVKGGPLRYLIVGMKQNHILQLWDLAIGKPIEELHFPHEKESDAICSVVYHAGTSMLMVGHPTRNSIYFIHLSAPKYLLPRTMSQAEFIEKIVAKDSTLPKPESTAVLSGVREYSFAGKGELRSLEILQSPAPTTVVDDPPLFELYAMHSKGVTCLSIRHEDLGWSKECKVQRGVDGKDAGVLVVDALKPLPLYSSGPPDTTIPAELNAALATKRSTAQPPKEILTRDVKPAPATAKSAAQPQQTGQSQKAEASATPSTNGKTEQTSSAEKQEKKRRKKEKAASAKVASDTSLSKSTSSEQQSGTQSISLVAAAEKEKGKVQPQSSVEAESEDASFLAPLSKQIGAIHRSKSHEKSAEFLRDLSGDKVSDLMSMVEVTQQNVSDHVMTLIQEQISALHLQLLKDKREQDASFDARQEALLRMVSETLSDNVEATLGKVVKNAITQSVIPSITSTTNKALSEQIGSKLHAYLQNDLPRELQAVLPSAASNAFKHPDLLKSITDSISKTISLRVEQQFATTLSKSITPAFTTLAVQTSKKVAEDVYKQASAQIAALETQHQADNAKIEHLTQLVTNLSRTVASMAASQASFQSEILRGQQLQAENPKLEQLTRLVMGLSETVSSMADSQAKFQEQNLSQPPMSRQTSARRTVSTSTVATVPAPSNTFAIEHAGPSLGEELQSLRALMQAGDTDEACMRWLHSDNKQEIFDEFFSKFDPDFTQRLNPLVLLSLCTTLGSNLETKTLLERVDWLEKILQTFSIMIHRMETAKDLPPDLTPRILEPTIDRLEALAAKIREISAGDSLVGRLSVMVSNARFIVAAIRGPRLPA